MYFPSSGRTISGLSTTLEKRPVHMPCGGQGTVLQGSISSTLIPNAKGVVGTTSMISIPPVVLRSLVSELCNHKL